MSVDKATGGDGFPDRSSAAEDKPFPGAPEDRGPAPELPKNTLSMEEVRAAHQKAGSNAEFEAGAEAHARAQAAGFSDSGSPDSGSTDSRTPGEGLAEADGEGAAPGARPGVQDGYADGTAVPGPDVPGGRQPEGFTRPERELPPFPGAPEDRGPAPAVPDGTPDMDYVRSVHQKAGSNAEFEAMAEKDAAARKEAAAAKPGADAAAAREAASPDGAAGENGEQRGEETDSGAGEETAPEQPAVLRAPQQEMPAAEAPDGDPAPLDGGRPDPSLDHQPDARHEGVVVLDQGEDAEAEPAPEGIEPGKDGVVAARSDAAAPEADDKPVVAGVVEPDRPEAGLSPEERDTGTTDATRSEVRLDTQSDERPVTRAEMMAMIAEMKAEAKAEAKAEMAAEHEAEIGGIKAENQELRQKFDDLEARVDADQSDGDHPPERKPDSGENPDASVAEQRGDRLPRETMVPDDPFDPQNSQDGSVADRQRSGEHRDDKNAEPSRWRRIVTSERVGAAGTVASAVNSAAMLGMHASPEGMVSLGMAILGVAGLGLAKAEKRRKEKNERQD